MKKLIKLAIMMGTLTRISYASPIPCTIQTDGNISVSNFEIKVQDVPIPNAPWRNLKKGMSEAKAKAFIGEPEMVETGHGEGLAAVGRSIYRIGPEYDYVIWRYPNGGIVWFHYEEKASGLWGLGGKVTVGGLETWKEPTVTVNKLEGLDRDAIAICQTSFEKINSLYISKNLRNHTVSFVPDVKGKNPLQKQQKEWESLAEEELSAVNITIENLNINEDFILGGIYWDFNNTLNLTLRISNKFSDKSFERLYMELYDVVRHEIRHLYDDSRGKNINAPRRNKQADMVENVRNASAFILSKAELTPYIDGMVLQAKKNHVPFSNLVVETVNKVFSIKAGDYKNNSIQLSISSQIQQIESYTIHAIIQKARSHYPNLQ